MDGGSESRMGKTGRGKRNQENEDDIASLLLSNTRAGTAHLHVLSDVMSDHYHFHYT